MKKLLSAGLCLSMFLLAGCQGQPQDTTLTITDQAGREVTFEEPCQTAASGYYITTTIMIGLQQQDKLTGIEMKPETRPIYAKAAEEILDLPQLGNKKMFNVEECAKAEDMGNFYRVPADNRGLNYDKYFKEGETERNTLTEFNSNNTRILNVEETKAKIVALDYIKKELSGEGNFVQ